VRVERNEFAAHDRCSESFDSTGYSSAWLERLTGGQKVVGSNPASPTPRFESEGPSAFRFRATGSVYSRRLRRRVAFSPAFSPLVLPCAPSAPVELVARPLRLARARYGASALRAESSNPAFSPAFSPLVLPCAPSAPVELVARPRSRLRSRQSRSAASKLAPPALARPRSPARTECARRTCGSPAFRPLWLVRVHLEFQSFPSIVSA